MPLPGSRSSKSRARRLSKPTSSSRFGWCIIFSSSAKPCGPQVRPFGSPEKKTRRNLHLTRISCHSSGNAPGLQFGHSSYPERGARIPRKGGGMPPRPRAEGAEHTSPGQSREAGAALGSWREILGRPARAAANGSSSGRCHSRWRQRITLPRMACGVWAAPLQGAGALEDINPGRRATALALGWPAARRWRAKCPNSRARRFNAGQTRRRDLVPKGRLK